MKHSLKKYTRQRGFTLVELMIVMFIIGMLAALAAPAFSKYVKKSRTAEAAGTLSKVFSGAVSYYEADHADSSGATVPKQFPVFANGSCDPDPYMEPGCCSYPDKRCPGNDTRYSGEPWVSLQFNLPNPHLYRPRYHTCVSVSGPFSSNRFVRAEATGNLDCDSVEARFIRSGLVNTSSGDLDKGGAAFEVNATE